VSRVELWALDGWWRLGGHDGMWVGVKVRAELDRGAMPRSYFALKNRPVEDGAGRGDGLSVGGVPGWSVQAVRAAILTRL
jgi:hypothetical protein